MLNDKMLAALNKQINAEFYSAYLYLAMSAYCDSIDMPGMAQWMESQFQEEQFHADRMFRYVNDRGGRVILKQINEPPAQWDSPLDMFQATLKHEQSVTRMINDLIALAESEKDYATKIFLQWYVSEQVEEEKNVSDIISMMRRGQEHPQIMFMMDQQLGQRVFTPPAAGGDN